MKTVQKKYSLSRDLIREIAEEAARQGLYPARLVAVVMTAYLTGQRAARTEAVKRCSA